MADDRRNGLAGDSFPLTINPAANAMGFARAQPNLRAAICPTGKSANLLSSPLCKNISVFTPPKSHLELFVSHPTRGAYHHRHARAVRCGGRGSGLRATGSQGGFSGTCERSAAR